MNITATSIGLTASHRYEEQHSQQESLAVWSRGQSLVVRNATTHQITQSDIERQLLASLAEDRLDISDEARALTPKKASVELDSVENGDAPMYDLELNLLKILIERFSGRKIELLRPEDFDPEADHTTSPEEAASAPAGGASELEGWGLTYDYYESYQEQEQLDFSAQGKVVTADGREISVDLSLSMSRSFASENHFSLRAGDALKDPLVINYAGTAASLTQTRFEFDLDADGRMDQISFVRPGSGFLALDRNGDGVINDGGELYGPIRGSGFAELAQEDEDGNGWIDESDSVYQRLRLWSKDESGADRLIGLGQAGVGAIYLGHIETSFQLKDADNQLQGRVAETGLFLRENGSSGTVQELDLVV